MLHLKSVQNCPKHQHQSDLMMKTLFDLYFESVESYLEWELRDESFECLSRLLEYFFGIKFPPISIFVNLVFVDDKEIICEVLSNQTNKLLDSIKSGIEDTVNYVRASSLRLASVWIQFLSNHPITNHSILVFVV